jgi:hypothetical protein
MHSANEWQENLTSILNKRPADKENPAPTKPKRRKHDRETYNKGLCRIGFTVDDYTVGWIYAFYIEMAAARSMLNDIYNNLGQSPHDSNIYILSSLHYYNVVIACFLTDKYGTNSAAIIASNIRRTFLSIQMSLIVGISGSVPGKVNIRFSNVVVSTGVI